MMTKPVDLNSIDLISDLNIVTPLDWSGQPQSLVCALAGNLSSDRPLLHESLLHLSRQYKQVFYIDGPYDHFWEWTDVDRSMYDLQEAVEGMDRVTMLHNQVLIMNKVAVICVNGWFSFDFNKGFDMPHMYQWMKEQKMVNQMEDSMHLMSLGLNDCAYLERTLAKTTAMDTVDEIVIMTATCPDVDLIAHDLTLQDTPRMNLMGNNYLKKALDKDVNNKVTTWMFGTYPHAINEVRDGIRWVSNPKADNFVYNPRPIQVRF